MHTRARYFTLFGEALWCAPLPLAYTLDVWVESADRGACPLKNGVIVQYYDVPPPGVVLGPTLLFLEKVRVNGGQK